MADRTACVDIEALPLQLLLRRHPEWTAHPVVVVDRDKPQGLILWANQRALAWRILPGMRYAAGLAIAHDLRGGAIADTEIRDAVDAIAQRLWQFSPRIEPSDHEPGVFWLDASGLRYVYPSYERWADTIDAELRAMGFRATVAVGFSRFGSYAAARASDRTVVFPHADAERAFIRRVPMERLAVDPQMRDTLTKLGIDTVGGFTALPASGVRKRFGAAAAAFHGFAKEGGWESLAPRRLFEPIAYEETFDFPEDNVDRLLIVLGTMLDGAIKELTGRYEKLAAIDLVLRLENGADLHEVLTPALPTLDGFQLLHLLRLRLESLTFPAPVAAIAFRATGIDPSQRQLGLFHDTEQDRDAVYRAFAKIRAELGNDAVVYARIQEAHLPEARVVWEPVDELPIPKPTDAMAGPLVRRIYTPAIELPTRRRHEPDGWLIAGVAEGPVDEILGPHLISGGWWCREAARAYHYVRTRSGRWLWIYHDLKRRRWFLHGEVQ